VLPKPFRTAVLRDVLTRQGASTQPTPASGIAAAARSRLTPEILQQAMARRLITIVAQPKVELAAGRVVGAEILARWRDPDLGVVPPDVFVAVAEAAGLMRELTLLVLDQSLDWFAGSSLRAKGGRSVKSHNPGVLLR
jgi:sensor c-di-GMP phosphodiesterase-like protein